ncbi:phage tail domain-containing protein [Nocardioides alkalitolerans]|uniref:phage tail domain-containing protein n=1 Tax=Nocardioides alkalitolerans TaxID=281714 RepID=UPI0004115CFC|nr:phage tail domain-containing protein [Nocardioides alkalitolerans]
MTVYVTVENATEALSLHEISEEGQGVEAIAGALGFGLPSVSLQFFEGAGDGGRLRSRRVEMRDIELPLHVYAPSRPELRDKVNQIARVFAGEMTLKVHDTDTESYVWTKVIRAGGGEFSYGEDTVGLYEWSSTVILRAGDPYWYHATETVEQAGDPGLFIVNNEGSADTYQTWEFRGPANRIYVEDDEGHSFEWEGELAVEDTLYVDSSTGAVYDQTGSSRYDGMGTAPELGTLPPGQHLFEVEVDEVEPWEKRNYMLNPNLTDALDWIGSNYTHSPGSILVGFDSPTPSLRTTGNAIGYAAVPEAGEVTVGLDLNISRDANPSWPVQVRVSAGDSSWFYTFVTKGQQQFRARVVVPEGEEVVTITVTGGRAFNGRIATATISKPFVGGGSAFFSGDDANDAYYSYEWTGEPNNSVSIATPLGIPERPDLIRCRWTVRDWLVI